MGLRVDRLKALREEHGWSQRELARRCGFALSLIGQYETGTSDPSVTYLTIMADQLGASTDYLLGRSDDQSGQTVTIIHELNEDEQELISTYRKDGWLGITHLGADRLAGKGKE